MPIRKKVSSKAGTPGKARKTGRTGTSKSDQSRQEPQVEEMFGAASPTGVLTAETAHAQNRLSVQMAPLVGNRQFSKMVNDQRSGSPPAVQRVLGGMALAGVLHTMDAIDKMIAERPALRSIHEEIVALAPKVETVQQESSAEGEEEGEGKGKGEERRARRNDLIEGFIKLRSRIPAEVVAAELGVSEDVASAIRRKFYTQLNKLGPFYAQWNNLNILGTEGSQARIRTCNVTVVSMVLEALGKTIGEFDGDDDLIANIVKAKYASMVKSVSELRFPDFLQLVAIYLELKRGNSIRALNAKAAADMPNFTLDVQAAANQAMKSVTNSENFQDFTKLFGVNTETYNLDYRAALEGFGDYYKTINKRFEAFLDNKGKKNARGEKREALRAEFTRKDKLKQRQKAATVGKRIGKNEAAVRQTEAEIAAIRKKMTGFDDTLAQLGGEIADLKVEIQSLEDRIASTEDRQVKKDLKAQLSEARASLRGKNWSEGNNKNKKKSAERDLSKLEAKRSKTLRTIANDTLLKSAREAVGSETDEAEMVEGVLPLQAYKGAVIPLMQAHIGSGAQVIVVMYQHFLKLQAIDENGITVHDPGGTHRDNKFFTWERARELGFFLRYAVMR